VFFSFSYSLFSLFLLIAQTPHVLILEDYAQKPKIPAPMQIITARQTQILDFPPALQAIAF